MDAEVFDNEFKRLAKQFKGFGMEFDGFLCEFQKKWWMQLIFKRILKNLVSKFDWFWNGIGRILGRNSFDFPKQIQGFGEEFELFFNEF